MVATHACGRFRRTLDTYRHGMKRVLSGAVRSGAPLARIPYHIDLPHPGIVEYSNPNATTGLTR
eukprot:4198752-Prymnesium_polylepis.1